MLLVVTLAAGACSSASDFEQVERVDDERNVAMATTTLLPGTVPPASTTSTVPPPGAGAPRAARVATGDAALMSMVGQLGTDPGLIAAVGQLSDASPAALAAMFGLDEQLLGQLGLTLAEVQGVAALIAGIDPATLAGSFGSGLGDSIDTSALDGLLAIAARLDAAAIAAVDGLTRQLVGAVVEAISTGLDAADPLLVALISALLDHLDPEGLGALSSDSSTASVLAVFAGAAVRTNPALLGQVRPGAANPALTEVVRQLEAIGSALDPEQAAALTAVGAQLTPQSLTALAELVSVLDAPTTRDLVARLGG